MFYGPEGLQLGKKVPPWPNSAGFLRYRRRGVFELGLAASISQAVRRTLGEWSWEL